MSLDDDMLPVQWFYLYISYRITLKGLLFQYLYMGLAITMLSTKTIGVGRIILFGLMDSRTPLIPSYISHEEFTLYHRIDRELYRILVINLYRDPSESMQVLAMWLWLETVGYRYLVKKITSLPYILVDEVAEETVKCLNHIKTRKLSFFSYMPFPSEGNDIPLLQSIMEKEISLSFLFANGALALQGVEKILRTVCVRAFGDIMREAITRNTTEKMVEAQKRLATQNSQPQFWFGSIRPSYLQRVGMVGGNVDRQLWVVHNYLTQQNNEVPADERTLFLTFSKGYPVEEWEVREFFTMVYGDCVESLYIQEVQPNEQALFARIVIRNLSTIDIILRGSSKAKFDINGKHVWARKFVPKRPKIFMPIKPSNNFTGESSGTAGM